LESKAMSGTIPLSMTQQFDQYGKPLSGGKLYTIIAGTVSTPQSAYQDSGLTLPWPNPITLDASGRIPQIFLADGLIKVRLNDKEGVVQLVADDLLVIGASSGGGGGGGSTVPTAERHQTGDIKPRYGTGIHSGWVRANGRTIGNSLSSATELASDTEALALYTHLWNVDPNLLVSGGARGPSAAADFGSPGTIGRMLTLPDARGVLLAGMDDMGNSPAGRLTAAYFGAALGGVSTVLGARGGAEGIVLGGTHIPSHQHDAFIYDPTHSHSVTANTIWQPGGGGGGALQGGAGTAALALTGSAAAAATGVRVRSTASGGVDDKTGLYGSGQGHNNVQHTMVVTFYLKL